MDGIDVFRLKGCADSKVEGDMVALHPEYVVDEKKHTKAVILSITEWELVIAELEALEDIRAYDATTVASDEAVPFERVRRNLRRDN